MRKTQITILTTLAALATPASAIELGLPIDCELAKSCFVQNYFDVDPGPEAKDFACGAATYDGHDGVDIRVLSLEAAGKGVSVVAAAAGTVRGLRDGVAEKLVQTEADRAAIAGRECGNGVVLAHEGGIETQYCHMKTGSVRVKQGQHVAAGEVLGAVGASGHAQFAHVHFEIRIAGQSVDPFTGSAADGACLVDAATAEGLWSKAALEKLGVPQSAILETGFATGAVVNEALEAGRATVPLPTSSSPALVFFARLINLRKGDRLRFAVNGPDGFQVTNESDPLARAKATYVAFAGKKLRAGAWPAGLYQGKVELVRDDAVVASAAGDLEMP